MINPLSFQKALLSWYDQHRRVLPWRVVGDECPNPYYTWISEIMLQQTTVPTVKDYFETFIHKWPRVNDLAQASLDEVLHAWQGLGYYARARNLYKCAQKVVQEYEGMFPVSEEELLKLPGIGPYTAAAIGAIAYDVPTTVVDGNVERIMSRLFRIETPLPLAKREIYQRAQALRASKRAGDYAQALMDVGSLICTPKAPKCDMCPLQTFCLSYKKDPENYPKRLDKIKKPVRHTHFFWIENEKGQVLLEKRPEKGLLGGMIGFPSTAWKIKEEREEPSINERDYVVPGHVKHTFTHFQLIGKIIKKKGTDQEGLWVHPQDLKDHALPTLMKKVIYHVRSITPQ